jgi:hypothetical protein
MRPHWPAFNPAYRDRRMIVLLAMVFGAGLVAVAVLASLANTRVSRVTNQNHSTQCVVIANTRYTADDLHRIETAAKCPITKALPRTPQIIVTVEPNGVRVTVTPTQPPISGEPLPPQDLATTTVTDAPTVIRTEVTTIPVPGPTRTVRTTTRATTTTVATKTVLPSGALCVAPLCTAP